MVAQSLTIHVQNVCFLLLLLESNKFTELRYISIVLQYFQYVNSIALEGDTSKIRARIVLDFLLPCLSIFPGVIARSKVAC
jgi:hypothetical protein